MDDVSTSVETECKDFAKTLARVIAGGAHDREVAEAALENGLKSFADTIIKEARNTNC